MSHDDLFIPLPRPTHSGTPILKWVLSRPNAHLYPLHLLTTGRQLDVVKEEIVVGYEEDESIDGDVSSFSSSLVDSNFDEANQVDVIDEEFYAEMGAEKEIREEQEEDGEEEMAQSPAVSHSFFDDDVFLQNPRDATSSSMMTLGGQQIVLPPISSFFSVLPPFPPTLHRPDEISRLIGLSEMLQQQQRNLTWMQHLQQPTLQQLLEQEQMQQVGQSGLLLHSLERARQEVAYDMRDHYDQSLETTERDWHDYSPVLPIAPVITEKNREDAVKIEDDDINVEDDVDKNEDKEEEQKMVVSHSKNAFTDSSSTAVKMQQLRQERRLVLSKEQKNVFRGLIERVGHLWPVERSILAEAFGMTEKQVLNVFINRGGRASQRREIGMSTEETQRIIREELLKFGFVPKEDKKKA